MKMKIYIPLKKYSHNTYCDDKNLIIESYKDDDYDEVKISIDDNSRTITVSKEEFKKVLQFL